jgi:NADH dehydrogenase (ubiquinone) Fe-S protein 5
MSSAILSTLIPLLHYENIPQIARAKAIKEEFVKKVQHQAAEGRKIADVLADGVITGVGLIDRSKRE